MASCTNCGSDWSRGQFTNDCPQCGGFALQAPCLVCGGRCGAVFQRSVHDSQDANLAHWAGACRLPRAEQLELMKKKRDA